MKLVLTSTLAPWISAVSTVLCLLFFVEFSDTAWRGDYFWTAEWIEGSLIPALALTAIAIGIDVHLTFDPRCHNVLASEDLRAPFVLRYVTALWLPLILLVSLSTVRWSSVWPSWWNEHAQLSYAHVGVCLLSILAFFILVMLAALAASPFGYIAGAAVGLLLVWTMMTGGGFLLLGTSTGSLVGYEPVPWVLGVVAAVAVLITGCGVWLFIRWSGKSAASTGSGSMIHRSLAGGLVLIMGVSPFLHLPENRVAWYKDLDCMKGEKGALCVSEQHTPLIDSLAWQYGKLRAVAAQFGVLDVIPVSLFTGMPSTHPGIHVNDGFDMVSGPREHPWYPSREELSDRVAHGYTQSFLDAVVIPGHCSENQQQALLPLYDETLSALQRMLDESLPREERQEAADQYRSAATKLDACQV